MSRRLRAYVALTALAALVVLTLCWPPSFARDWGHYVAWIVICLVSETMWSNTMSGSATWSLSATAGLSSAVLWGPAAGIWISALSTLIADLFVLRKPAVRVAFNAGQIAVATWLGATLFGWLGGRTALPVLAGGSLLDRAHATTLLLPFLGLVVGYYAVNRAMVALAVAWSTGRGWWQTLVEDWLYMARLEVDAASFLLTPLMVISFTTVGYPGVLLFYAPLFMLFQSDKRFIELKRAEEVNLRNARFAAKGELAAGIGHELNNQLVAISGRAQMLLRDAEKQTFEKAPHHAQIILDQSKRMGVLAKGLMDYTRSNVNVEPMDLNGMLTSTIEFVKSDKRFRGVEWDIQFDPELPQVRADVGQIQGVFINLFVNAADAMGAQESRRAIRVSTKLDPRAQAAEIEVQDTGPGIKREHLGRMFEFMFTTKPEGHGFGLSTSHRTIENHGGKITVDSEPGNGARFHIELPLSGPGELALSEELGGAPIPQLGRVEARPTVATVCRIDFGSIRLLPDDGSDFEASVPAKQRGARKALGNAVVTGDRVALTWDHDRALVESVEPRRNVFSRRAAGEREEEQVVAANLDQVVIVAALQRPDFSPGLVDRVLVQCERAGIPALLALNKTDLDARHEADALLAEYARAGVHGLACCAKSGQGVEAVREACVARRTLFVGHSGVGKSTLLSKLMPHVTITQGEVNEVTGKGRHTTSAAVLYRPAPGNELVDTPGVRAFALWGVEAGDLVEYYPELEPLVGGCRFSDCRHDREPGCALRAAVERGEVGERRFASYCKLRDELADGIH